MPKDSRPPPLPGSTRLGDVTLRAFRRTAVTTLLFAVVLALFLAMVHEMLVAGILGVIIGAYLRPVYVWIAERTGMRALAATITLALLIAPGIALIAYGYLEIRGAIDYLEANTAEVARQIDQALTSVPFLERADRSERIELLIERLVTLATEAPPDAARIVGEFALDTSIFLFTAFYVLTRARTILAYVRGKVPRGYGALAESLEEHVQGVLYGAVFSTLITQTLKSLVQLVVMLALGVPLAVVLALITFVIGFFPVVGSWSVYLPVAGYLIVFEQSPWKALIMLVVGFGINTLLLSMIVRPKIAAEQSHVLDFYWMFIGLIAGVYAFGVPGVVIGPIIVGLLKAVFDTITDELPWMRRGEEDGPEAKIFSEEEVERRAPPSEGP